MTSQSEKAEAVLAAFRGEVACPKCHHFVSAQQLDKYALYMKVDRKLVRVCYRCWLAMPIMSRDQSNAW